MGVQPADEILQHRAFPCALPADDRYLRQVQVARLADGAEGVLQLVDEGDEVFHSPVPHDGSSAGPRRALSCSPAGRIKTPNGSAPLPAKAQEKRKKKRSSQTAPRSRLKLNSTTPKKRDSLRSEESRLKSKHRRGGYVEARMI